MALVKWLGRWGVLCGLFGLAAIGCGDDSDDEGDGGGEWKCFDDPGYECDCEFLPPGENWSSDGDEVSSCPTYPLCVKYYDTFFELDSCACGPSDFMPFDATDIEPVATCPPPG